MEPLEPRCLLAASSLVWWGVDDHLIYRPDAAANRIPDFSDVGYQAGRQAIPHVPTVVTVAPVDGDDTASIQNAINQMAAMPLGPDGFRGAILLERGHYDIAGQILINASGIVIRGQGRGANDTVLHARGDDRRPLIRIDGSGSRQLVGPAVAMIDFTVPVGARSFRVASTSDFQVGDSILIKRPSTAEWIQDIGMDRLANPWAPGSKNLDFERVITRIEGDFITIDAPLTNSFEQRYGGGTVQKFRFPGRIENIGVENLRGESDYDSDTDEDHSWDFISINRAQDVWVRDTKAMYFAYAHVNIARNAKRVTVQDAINHSPKSEITGGRRYAFNVVGQQNLVTGVESKQGRHDFVFGSTVAGPNVFHKSVAIQAYSDSGPHHRWATGGLFDNIVTNHELNAQNRWNSGTGHGWSGANMVFYNSTANGYRVQNPLTAQNWLIGSTGALRGSSFANPLGPLPGIYDSHGTRVAPDSLYEAQLAERMAFPQLDYREYWLGDIDGFTGHASPVDEVYVDPAWRAALPGNTIAFDQLQQDVWVPFSFVFGLAPGERVVGATLGLGMMSAGGTSDNDRIYLDDVSRSLPFSDLWQVDETLDGFVLDLGSHLDLLQDGQLNLAVHGNTGIDWAVLNLQVQVGQAVVYVNDDFAGNRGDTIADADLGTGGAQPAIYGVDAFRTIAEALAAVTTDGTIIVNGGVYAESVHLIGNQTLIVTGADVAQEVTLDALTAESDTVIRLEGSLAFTGIGTSRFGSLNVRSNRTEPLTMTIPAGHTLHVTGNVSIGIPGVVGATTHLTVTGGGALNVSNPSATVDFGLPNSNQGAAENLTTVDLSGLGSFIADVDHFRVGYGSRNHSTLRLSDTANVITANLLTVSDSGNHNARPGVLVLGNGTNVLNVDHIQAGLGKGDGRIAFASQAFGSPGTVTIRGRNGGFSAANVTLGSDPVSATGVSPTGTLDLRGHDSNVVVGTLTMARRTMSGSGGAAASVWFDTGVFTVDTVDMATKSHGDGSATATIHVGGGAFTVLAGGRLQLAKHTGGGPANGRLNVTGGTFSTHVDLLDGGGNSTTSITLNGGTLDLNGRNLGDVTPIDELDFQSGTLQHIGQINDGATGFRKTSSGTLVMLGTNSYTGTTDVQAGTLWINGTNSGSGHVTVSGSAVLHGTGAMAAAVVLADGSTGTLSPGAPGSDTASLATGSLTLHRGTRLNVQINGTTGGTQYDQLDVTGTVRLDEATLSIALGFTPVQDDAFTLIKNDASEGELDPVFGMFEGLPEGALFTVENGEHSAAFRITYEGGEGHDVVLITLGIPVETTTTVASSANPSTYGDSVFFTATVSAEFGAPAGTVQFIVNGTDLGTPVTVVQGVAQSASISTLNAGNHAVTAQYVPAQGAAFAGSTGQLTGRQEIAQRAITVTAATDLKVYDGTTDSSGEPTITSGSLAGADFALWTQTFDHKNVGIGKTLTPAGVVNDGNSGANYVVNFANDTTGTIIAAPLEVIADPARKTAGMEDPPLTFSASGFVADESVATALTGSIARAPGEDVGIYAIHQGSLAAWAGNYEIAFTGAHFQIIPAASDAVRRFDFNQGGSPTQRSGHGVEEGSVTGVYVGVKPDDVYTAPRGYGWVTAVKGFDRGPLNSPDYSDLLRDGAWHSRPGDFRIQVESGKIYDVTVTFGDARFPRDRMNVAVVTGSIVAGLENVTHVATAAGQHVHRSFQVLPNSQGDLVLRFSNGGGDPYWTVGAVEVRHAYGQFTVAAPEGELDADGRTRDVFTVAEGQYRPGAWYTLSTDMGRIATADAEPRYAGVQVQAPSSGTFEIEVQRGTNAGRATVRVEEVNGASRGWAMQDYVFAPVRRFDFNGSGLDTQQDTGAAVNPWWNARGGDVYSETVGYGWDLAVSEFQRSTSGISQPQWGSLYRDGHWQSATRTFQVAVDPTKEYDVRIHTGDRDFSRNRLQVTVEGVVQPLVATAANEFQTIPVDGVTVSDGILDIRIANLGGDPYWVINGIEVAESDIGLPELPGPDPNPPTMATLRFDFGTSSSLLEDGFTQVGASNVYSPDAGYGWQTNASTFNRSGPTALLQDGHWGTNNVFLVNVDPSAQYVVNVTVGDANFARNHIEVAAYDPVAGQFAIQIPNLATAAGQFVHAATGVVSPNASGQLAIRVRNTGGDPYFTINALEVFPVLQGELAFPAWTPGQVADGTTWDTITVSNANAGAMYTVHADLGVVRGPDAVRTDASTVYAGFQVVAGSDGTFEFQVQRPTGLGSGKPRIQVEEVTGLTSGSLDQTYTLPTVRRFDFNGSGNDTQPVSPPEVAFLGVRGNTLYNDQRGYGWTRSVSEFQRGTTGYSINSDNVPLYRDGHWGSASRTFQVALDTPDSDQTYNVRVYVGDRNFARNNIQAKVNESAWVNMNPSSISANQFTTIYVENVTAADGKLNISIRNAGGDPYWVINGIDVWRTGTNDPGELTLLADTWGTEMVGGWLTEAAIEAVVPAAREYWVSTGLSDWQVADLHRTPVSIGDLSYRNALGVTRPEGIWLDASGAGLGWHSSILTPNSQLLTSSYDLLTVLTHELGHVIGYDDLDPQSHPDHIMSGVLQPGVSRIGLPTNAHHVAAQVRDAVSPNLGSFELLVVDRALDDLLHDAPRAAGDRWTDSDDEYERLLSNRSDERYEELDAFFARL